MTEKELIALALSRGGSVGQTAKEAVASCRLDGETQVIETDLTGDRMNKTERAYSVYLDGLKRDEVIQLWMFESIKLRLADKTWYTPDFFVITSHGRCEFHETKGFWRDDARVKWKVAAEMYPWALFKAVKKNKGGWSVEHYRKG